MSAGVVHFEIPLDNVERGHKFYKDVFGWQLDVVPQMEYAMVQTSSSDQDGTPKDRGVINGGLAKRGDPLRTPTVTIMVDDIVATGKTVEKHGGKVLQNRMPIGDGSIGFSAYFKDSEGNVIGLFERPKP